MIISLEQHPGQLIGQLRISTLGPLFPQEGAEMCMVIHKYELEDIIKQLQNYLRNWS